MRPGTGTVDVTVTIPVGGTSATSTADQFTYVAAPTVTGVSPTTGAVAGGTTVTITGFGFTRGHDTVDFGSTAATTFTVNSATQITATDAAGTGEVDVTVTVYTSGAARRRGTYATSATSSADEFTYAAPWPTASRSAPTRTRP